jgi:predicted Zn-ribbon and HTH transcriptional regulator
VSANESEKELYDIISRMEKKNETEGKKIVDQTFENSAGFEFKETRTRNNSNVPRYTDPKYDFLKKEKYDEIYKNVYKTTLFKSILKK